MNKQAGPLLMLFGVFTCALSPALSQDQEKQKNSLQEGKWALEFSIAGNLTLGPFDGMTLGGQYMTSENAAWRGALSVFGVGGNQTNLGSNSSTNFPPSTASNSSTNGNHSISLSNVFMTRSRYFM